VKTWPTDLGFTHDRLGWPTAYNNNNDDDIYDTIHIGTVPRDDYDTSSSPPHPLISVDVLKTIIVIKII